MQRPLGSGGRLHFHVGYSVLVISTALSCLYFSVFTAVLVNLSCLLSKLLRVAVLVKPYF